MTPDQIILFALFGGVFGLLLWGRFRYDLVAFSALLLGVVLGVIPAKEAFSGFGHPATIVVALVLVVSAGLVRSGTVLWITRAMVDSTRGVGAHIAIMGGIGAVLSAFMNNVAALALLMPVDLATARKAGRAVGITLMPLSFATILGGMVTLIGTPPNIVIAGIRGDRLGESYGMFDFAPVGLAVALAGMAFVALLGWRLIPVAPPDPEARDAEPTAFVAELTVVAETALIDRKLHELQPEAEEAGVHLIGVIRGGRRLFGPARHVRLRAGDQIVIEAAPTALDEFRAALGLAYSDAKRMELIRATEQGLALIEVVVPETSRIAGKSAEAIGLAWRQRTILMGISRQGRRITDRLRRERIRPGDILLLLTPAETAEDMVHWLSALPLADRGAQVTETRHMKTAVGLFAAAILAASVGLIDLTVALGLVTVGYVLARIVPLQELYDQIEWPVVVLLGSMIPLGAALDAAGGTRLIADSLTTLTAGQPAWVALLVLMVVTMTMSDVLNNTATAIVAAPVGIEMAATLGVNPDPFLMAVAVAASCAFLTPIGHKNNTLILGPGGYRFGDYWRMGLPLEVIVIAVGLPAILMVWPL